MFDATGGYVKDADYYTSPTHQIRAPSTSTLFEYRDRKQCGIAIPCYIHLLKNIFCMFGTSMFYILLDDIHSYICYSWYIPKYPNWLVVSIIVYFPFHIWDVIPTPLTNSIIFQDGEIARPTRYIMIIYLPFISIGP